MRKKIILILFICLFTFPVVYGFVCPEHALVALELNFSNVFIGVGMAKVFGVFTSMKGKLGNAVFQTWKGIQVLRTRVIPHNPQSSLKLLIVLYFHC